MDYTSIVDDLKIMVSNIAPKAINETIFDKPHLKISENSFFLNIYNVAQFHAEKGNTINIYPNEGVDKQSIQLFLNGAALGAILLQRKILSLHGTSFVYNNKGITICGHAGAGKSSVTAAYCQEGAKLITDDISPIIVTENIAFINPLKTTIKLWDDTLDQLEFNSNGLTQIRPSINKFYFDKIERQESNHPLHTIIILNTHNSNEYKHNELIGIEKFNAIRNNIYRKIYLRGMPETERIICKQILVLSNYVRIHSVLRPKKCSIESTKKYIEDQILNSVFNTQ